MLWKMGGLPDDGLLAIDLNGDGVINTGAELFGNETELADGTKAANGFLGLAANQPLWHDEQLVA